MSFGGSTAKPFSFGTSFGTSATTSQTQPSVFSTTQNKPSLFGSSTTQPTSNIFGTSTQPAQTGFGASAQQPQKNIFGQSFQQQQQSQAQRPPAETLQFGQTLPTGQTQSIQQQFQQSGNLSPYRSVPAQLQQVQSKWNPNDFSSPFRTYLFYNVEKEEEAVKYQPEPTDDVNEWEKAVSRRPGPTYVPKLYRGFEGLAERAKMQQQFLIQCHEKLVAINNSLEVQMDRHKQFIATRLAETRRRHERISRRTLALAVKVQILRNKGYVLDNAEEELKEKLGKLEREVMDPSLDGREQEIWAHMIEIRERSKRIKAEMDKIAPEKDGDAPVLTEEMVEKAKKVLEDYDKKLRHLRWELDRMQEEYDNWQKDVERRQGGITRRR